MSQLITSPAVKVIAKRNVLGTVLCLLISWTDGVLFGYFHVSSLTMFYPDVNVWIILCMASFLRFCLSASCLVWWLLLLQEVRVKALSVVMSIKNAAVWYLEKNELQYVGALWSLLTERPWANHYNKLETLFSHFLWVWVEALWCKSKRIRALFITASLHGTVIELCVQRWPAAEDDLVYEWRASRKAALLWKGHRFDSQTVRLRQ